MTGEHELSSLSVDRKKVEALLQHEQSQWYTQRPKCRDLHERAKRTQLNGTPKHRTNNFPSAVPIYITRAEGARIEDMDGHSYSDFMLSGSAALFGHRHPAVVAAMREQMDTALISDWPSADHVEVTELLEQKFGLPVWQFTLSVADANRCALRFARIATNRQKILVFSHTYYGALDETHAVLANGRVALPDGVSRNGFDVETTTAVADFNDADGAERILRTGEIAAVIVEPAITTRRTIVMPDPSFHRRLREITRETGTLLVVDETQTMAAGPGGFTREFGLDPDLMTMGKWIAGGLPVGMYGMTRGVADAVSSYGGRGMGSTLAGGALSTHVMKCMLREVITEQSYSVMKAAAGRYADAVGKTIGRLDLPWHVTSLGARVAFGFDEAPPRSGTSFLTDGQVEARSLIHRTLWFFLANRGVLFGGWDCTSLFCPLLEDKDVDLHIELIEEAIAQIAA